MTLALEIKHLIKKFFIKDFLQPGSALKFPSSRCKSPIYTFLPSDPDELVDQLENTLF